MAKAAETTSSNNSPCFKAGKCLWDGGKVTSVKKKGVIKVVTLSNGAKVLKWSPRDEDKDTCPEDTVAFSSADITVKKIEACTTGRIYVVREGSNVRFLFWMQEINEKNDEESITKLVNCLKPNNSWSSLRDEIQRLSLGIGGTANRASSARVPNAVTLSDILTSDVLTNLANDEEALEDLQQHMPASQQTSAATITGLHCSQLRQAISALSQAVESDQLPVLLMSMGLDTPNKTTNMEGTRILIDSLHQTYGDSDEEMREQSTNEPPHKAPKKE